MNSTIPADLLEFKARFETWRTNRRYVREQIPDELRRRFSFEQQQQQANLLPACAARLGRELRRRGQQSKNSISWPGTHAL
jgi:hypothetical protein